MHCNLRPSDVALVVLGYLGQFLTAHAHKLLFRNYWYINSDVTLRSSNLDILKMYLHAENKLSRSKISKVRCHVGVARGCTGCMCTLRAEKNGGRGQIYRGKL